MKVTQEQKKDRVIWLASRYARFYKKKLRDVPINSYVLYCGCVTAYRVGYERALKDAATAEEA